MSLLGKRWQIFEQNPSLCDELSAKLSISPLTAQILINRGIEDLDEARIFLESSINNLSDPMEIPGIIESCKKVLSLKGTDKKILVYGDYDVDGVAGTAILVLALKKLGFSPEYYVPHRYSEGYGMNIDAVKDIKNKGIDLIITVDCGISNFKEIELANSLGMEVIVTDHHNLPKELPNAAGIVNPKLFKDAHPSKQLSGAGVAFKFAWALMRLAGIKESDFLTELLDLVCLGTIADVVPLTKENRILVVQGLKVLNQKKRVGLKHLVEQAGISGNISIRHVNFALAPRLNAAGRLEHASLSIELLLCEDENKAMELARELNKINVRRQGIGSDIKGEANIALSLEELGKNKLILLSGDGWHPGVIGIVASRIVEEYYRPTVIIGVEDGVGRGSARSINGFNVFELLNTCADLYLDFGGHEGAAGFEIEQDKIPILIDRLKKEAETMINIKELVPKILIDSEIIPSGITLEFVKELESLDPHGQGNPSPLFMSKGLDISDWRKVGNGNHLKIKFTDGKASLDAIGFSMGDIGDKLLSSSKYDIAFNLEANEWNGFKTAQLKLVDIRKHN